MRKYAQLARSEIQKHARRATKEEGTVAEFFSNLTTEGPPLEPRFAALKKEMCVDRDALVHSWRAVLRELAEATEEIARRGNEVRFRGLWRRPFGEELSGCADGLAGAV